MANNSVMAIKSCGAIFPPKVFRDLEKKVFDIATAGLVSAALSLIGSLSIVGIVIWKRLTKSSMIQPLLHLSVADLILSFLWIFSSIIYLKGSEISHPEGTAIYCFVSQLVTEMIHLVTFFLTVNYSVNVYFKMKDKTVQVHMITEGDEVPNSEFRIWFRRALYGLSWISPVLLMMPVIAKTSRGNISVCQKCVILIDVPMLQGTDLSWFTKSYGYIILSLSLSVSTITIIVIYCLTLRLYWRAVPGFRTDRQRRQLANMQTRVTLYMLAFILCWAPALMISYHKWVHMMQYKSMLGLMDVHKLYGLYLFQAIFAPLQGFLNSVVYGWSRKTFRSISLKKSPISPLFGSSRKQYNAIPTIPVLEESYDSGNLTNGYLQS